MRKLIKRLAPGDHRCGMTSHMTSWESDVTSFSGVKRSRVNGGCWTDCGKNQFNLFCTDSNFLGNGQQQKVKLPMLGRFNQQIHEVNKNELIMQGSKRRQGWVNACDEYICIFSISPGTPQSPSAAVKSIHETFLEVRLIF